MKTGSLIGRPKVTFDDVGELEVGNPISVRASLFWAGRMFKINGKRADGARTLPVETSHGLDITAV